MVVGEIILETDLVVLGGGPGGYTAAIHAADHGLDVVLVEKNKRFGGVCLTEGCIPSKTLINAVSLKEEVNSAQQMGLTFTGVDLDLDKLRQWMESVVDSLSSGIGQLLENRDIDVIQGTGRFIDENRIYVEGNNTIIRFKHAIIATGSSINRLPGNIEAPVWSSAKALTLPEIPESLLVIGGGYIGLEIGQAYAGLGSRVSLVEFNPHLLAGADPDLVKPVFKNCERQFEQLYLDSKVTGIEPLSKGFNVTIKTADRTIETAFDQVLAATGRKPNTDDIGLDHIGLTTDESGRIPVNEECRTQIHHIFAVGDITRGPALAHKAAREGKVAAEVIAEKPSAFDNISVPAVLFTHPEISWTGLTETEAKDRDIAYKKGVFPLTALGRAKSMGKTTGFVKILSDPESDLILGMGIVGEHASELIAEGNLAIEMGACLEDLIVSIHPHPTFSESIMEAAEMAKHGSVHLFRK